jgi:threonine/homoserine/homoserine lactone efflux protein
MPATAMLLALLLLGLFFNVGTLVNLGVAYAVGAVSEWLRKSATFARVQKWFTGLVFLGLGARLAFQRK